MENSQYLSIEPGIIKLSFYSPNYFSRLICLPKFLIDVLDTFSQAEKIETAQNIYCFSKCSETSRQDSLSKIFTYGKITQHALKLLPIKCRPEHDYYKNNTIEFQGITLHNLLEKIKKEDYAFADSSLLETKESDWLLQALKKSKLKKEISLEDFVLGLGLGKVSILGDSIFLEGYPWPLHSMTFFTCLFSYYLDKKVSLSRRYKTNVPSAEFVILDEVPK